MMAGTSALLTGAEVQAWLRVSHMTIWRLSRPGQPLAAAVVQIGTAKRWTRTGIQAFIDGSVRTQDRNLPPAELSRRFVKRRSRG